MKKIFITILAAAAVLTSCQEKTFSEGKGNFVLGSVNIDRNTNVVLKSGEIDTEAELAKMSVQVKSKTSTFELNYNSYSEIVGQMVEVPAGTYTVTTQTYNPSLAAWDQPIFKGQSDFSVVAGASTPVSVVCPIQNVKVAVNCTDEVFNEFETFQVIVKRRVGETDDNTSYLTWDKTTVGTVDSDTQVSREGWFDAASLTVQVKGTRLVSGVTHDLGNREFIIKDLNPRDYVILNIDAQETGAVGTGGIQIEFDTQVNERPVDLGKDEGFTWEPIPDEPDQPENPDQPEETSVPTLEWAANPNFDKMTIAKGMDVNLVVKAPEKIKGFVVKVSDNFKGLLAMVAGAEELDLIGNPTVVENMGSMLPTGDKLLDQVEVNFSLSELVPLIAEVGTQGEDYDFTLEVTDGKGQKLVQTLTFFNPVVAE